MFRDLIFSFDKKLIESFKKIAYPFARIAIFIVYFWFGLLKILGLSPASPLVLALLNITMPFIPPENFIFGFGVFEVLIGLTFLIPKLERTAIFLLFVHLITTALPLLLLKNFTWSGVLIPTLEGQYIIKNILIIGLAIVVASHLRPWSSRTDAHT